jgi:uncharacterized protein (TIGR02996 family)
VTSDQLALLAAIRANPDEDVPRLMYADEIEGDDPRRAELIRAQCAFAREPGRHDLRDRAGNIIANDSVRWRFVACSKCGGSGKLVRIKPLEIATSLTWMDSLVGPLSDPLFETERIDCPDCAQGDVGGLCWLRHQGKLDVAYVRGMKRVICVRGAICFLDSEGEWQVTPLVRRICEHHPDVMEIEFGDRAPNQVGGSWWWWREGSGVPYAQLPNPIFDVLLAMRVVATRKFDHRVTALDYPSQAEATTVAARAVDAWVRGVMATERENNP